MNNVCPSDFGGGGGGLLPLVVENVPGPASIMINIGWWSVERSTAPLLVFVGGIVPQEQDKG